jgi:hypothetical protein
MNKDSMGVVYPYSPRGEQNSTVKIWLLALLLIPTIAWSDEPAPEGGPQPATEEDPPITWVDTSHAYATDQAQALTQWMDDFFGNPEYNLDQAESFLRLITEYEWDQSDGNDFGVKLRGKVQLPKISSRLDLVFSGEDDEENLDRDEQQTEDTVGLRFNVREGRRSRFDATLGFASGHLRPGLRYRLEDNFGQASYYRFTQRLQYENGEDLYATTQLELNRALSENSLVRWANRGIWGQETEGVEWRSNASVRHRLGADTQNPLVLSYFAAAVGVTDPEYLVKNYKFGVKMRRRVYRDFLFLELEPAINFRRRSPEVERETALSMMVRLEILLQRDLRRYASDSGDGKMRPIGTPPPATGEELADEKPLATGPVAAPVNR